ncbi:MAG: dipicolinate synthase subunit DpsA [Clostridia bacterium]|nr:dipicolinate synthase subunit DpsA [Clostridia bacterium]
MGNKLAGVKVALIGGDERQVVLANSLIKFGAQVKVIGFEERPELTGCQFCTQLSETIENVHAIILPMAGTDLEGNVITTMSSLKLTITEEFFQSIPGHVPIFLGVAKSFLKEWARFYNKKVIEIANLDEIAILNSIPTAEGALQMAMAELPITIHGSKSVVIGFGRCGKTLARKLDALGADTVVFARKPEARARILEMGLKAAEFKQMPQILPKADLIFNTVPVQVLDKNILSLLNKDTLIIDIATAPGGTDFKAAEKLGIKAILAPSLPGKFAPKTAGLILAQTLPDLILKEISLSLENEVGGKGL